MEQRAHGIRIALFATDEELEAVRERIERTLCPDPEHPGACQNAWQIVTIALDDMDDDERPTWCHMVDDLLEQRQHELAECGRPDGTSSKGLPGD